MFQKLAQFGVHAAGNVVTVAVIALLVLAWVLTSPLVWLGDRIVEKRKRKSKTKENYENDHPYSGNDYVHGWLWK